MQYKNFINDSIKVSTLGYGCMRFPLLDENDNGSINEEESFKLLKYAIDNGINYIDTAYPYHNGNSEIFVGKSLKKIGREKIYLATKMPVWLCKKHEDYNSFFNEQLDRLQTDYIDFYLVHSLTEESFRNIVKNDIFSFLNQKKKNGHIKYIGFSFHDNLNLFKEIVDSYNWDFCQIQLNYMDENYQAGIKGLNYAKSKGLDVIVMEPVKGGKLATAPVEAKKYFNNLNSDYSLAQWALKWVYNLENVSLALSGMSNLNELKENIQVASETTENSLTTDELNAINNIKEYFNNKIKVGCTSCEYCMPCPSDIEIPTIFSMYNNAFIYNEKNKYIKEYSNLISENKDASKCIRCGKCEKICPQHLNIIDLLCDADNFFI